MMLLDKGITKKIIKDVWLCISKKDKGGESMNKLKNCSCGCDKIKIEQDYTQGIYECSIGCLNINCSNIITRLGHSKADAYEKAVKTWNENN